MGGSWGTLAEMALARQRDTPVVAVGGWQIIGPPAVHELHERGTPHVHTGVVPGEITVPAGSTVETSWTFGPSGEIAYGCHLAGHWAYGMHGLAIIR